jgi:hypothetical protein
VSFGKSEVAFSVQNAHARPMSKTWVPKGDLKSAKAFAKAMRPLLNPKNGNRQNSRPR